jgi:hypothetical protein
VSAILGTPFFTMRRHVLNRQSTPRPARRTASQSRTSPQPDHRHWITPTPPAQSSRASDVVAVFPAAQAAVVVEHATREQLHACASRVEQFGAGAGVAGA